MQEVNPNLLGISRALLCLQPVRQLRRRALNVEVSH